MKILEKNNWLIKPTEGILVTGANGFIGSRVVKRLLREGFKNIRCFVRSENSIANLKNVLGDHNINFVGIIEGNLLDFTKCKKALEGISLIYHLAAGIDSSFAGCFINSVITTKNLLDASIGEKVFKRFVNISSFAVYSNLKMHRGALLDETSPLENMFMERYDPYCFSKRKQEQIIEKYNKEYGLRFVNLRPGAVYGPGKKQITGRIGIDTFGIFMHLGGSNKIPFTFVDNCADAIVLSGLVEGTDGHTLNIIDDDLPTSEEFVRQYKNEFKNFRFVSMPYLLTKLLCSAWEGYSKWSKGQLPPRFNKRRCAAEWKGNTYSNEKIKQMTGWRPKVSFHDGSKRYFSYLKDHQ